jgi:hypothetical protein
MRNFKLLLVVLIGILTLVIALVLWAVFNKSTREINSFEDCAKAGYPVLQTYPAQCKTPDGRVFTEDQTR